MRAQIETITPAQAEAYLLAAAGHRQRPLTQARVRTLARAITDGQWRVTHQAIAFDPDGILIDGQHRIAAIALAGVTVDILVVRDADASTFDLIDTGRSRGPAQTLAIAGHANSVQLAAAGRYYLMYRDLVDDARVPSGELRNKWTAHDVLRLMESPTGLRLTSGLALGHKLGQAIGRPGVITWMSTAITVLDEAAPDAMMRSEYLERLESGAMLEAGSPILAYRRWLINDTGYDRLPKNHAGWAGLNLFIKSWNAWVEQEPVYTASFRVGIEPAPRIVRHQDLAVPVG